jgi:hypothetical protein
MAPTFLQIVLPKHVVSVLFAFIRVARALDRREDFPQAAESSFYTRHVRIESVRMIYKT